MSLYFKWPILFVLPEPRTVEKGPLSWVSSDVLLVTTPESVFFVVSFVLQKNRHVEKEKWGRNNEWLIIQERKKLGSEHTGHSTEKNIQGKPEHANSISLSSGGSITDTFSHFASFETEENDRVSSLKIVRLIKSFLDTLFKRHF